MEAISRKAAKEPPDAHLLHHGANAPPSPPPSPKPAPGAPPPILSAQQPPPSEPPLTTDNTIAETTSTMAPGGGSRRPPPRREADLSVVLTMPQKTDLITLVTAIMENMQAKVIETFQYCGTELARSQTSVKIWVYTPEMVSQKVSLTWVYLELTPSHFDPCV